MTDRPNVVLILQDQLRYDVVHDPGPCGTPAQDDLQRQGVAFLNHYAPMGVCSPSRASLMTGLYPHGNGVMNNMNGTDALRDNLSLDHASVARALQGAGYRTGYLGKWHLGKDAGPATRGFDDVRLLEEELLDPTGRFSGYVTRFRDRTPDTVWGRHPAASERHRARFARRPFPMYSTEVAPEEVLPAHGVAEGACDLLANYAAGGQPFFLVVSFLEPHWPNVLPEPYASMYPPEDVAPWPNLDDDFTGKPRTLQAAPGHFGVQDFTWDDWAPLISRYLGTVGFIDELVGRIVGTVDDLGLGDETMVVASCDHGDMTGAHGQFNKGRMMYEEVYHVPFLVRWPGHALAGGTVERLTSHVDVMPSLLEAVGIEVPEGLHGVSLVALMKGEDPVGWRDALMCEYHGDEFGLYTQRMLRHGGYKFIHNPHDIDELYDLEVDPYELTNLANDPDYLEIRTDLEVRLLELMHDLDDPHRLFAVNTLG